MEGAQFGKMRRLPLRCGTAFCLHLVGGEFEAAADTAFGAWLQAAQYISAHVVAHACMVCAMLLLVMHL